MFIMYDDINWQRMEIRLVLLFKDVLVYSITSKETFIKYRLVKE